MATTAVAQLSHKSNPRSKSEPATSAWGTETGRRYSDDEKPQIGERCDSALSQDEMQIPATAGKPRYAPFVPQRRRDDSCWLRAQIALHTGRMVRVARCAHFAARN